MGKYESPLSYVIRESLIPPPLADNPAADYPPINDKFVKRMPIIVNGIIGAANVFECTPDHHTMTFKADSQTVLNFLREVLEYSFM